MKLTKITFVSGLILISVLLGGCSGDKSQAQIIKEINSPEAETLIKSAGTSGNLTIIDVRTTPEYSSGHIENAINLDVSSSTFKDELEKLDKDKIYLVYCGTGRRSQAATDIMQKLGFREVYSLSGGITEWDAQGLPTMR